MNHHWSGPSLRDWKTHRGIRRKSKIISIVMLAVTLTPTIVFIVPLKSVKFLLAAIGISVAIYIGTRPDPDKMGP